MTFDAIQRKHAPHTLPQWRDGGDCPVCHAEGSVYVQCYKLSCPTEDMTCQQCDDAALACQCCYANEEENET